MTARYRVRAEGDVFVIATQWFPSVTFLGICYDANDDSWGIDTFPVVAGDWIVVSEDGHRFVCKPDVFRDTYEATGET